MDLTSDQLVTWGGTVVRLSVVQPGSCELVALLHPVVEGDAVAIDGTTVKLPTAFFDLSALERAQALWNALQFKTGEPWASARARRDALQAALNAHAAVEDRVTAYAGVGVDLKDPGVSPVDQYRHMALAYEDLAPVADRFAEVLNSPDAWRAATFIRPMLEAAMREGMDPDQKAANRSLLASHVVSQVNNFAVRAN